MAPILSFIFGSLLAARAFAEPFEKLFQVPEGWKLQGPAADTYTLKLQIALQQDDVAGFEQTVMDISTPSNPKYGQHIQSHAEMKRMLMPSEETVSSVSSWLKAAGIEDFKTDADWVTFQTTVGVANELLGTKFSWFVSEESKPRKILRTLEYSVPDEIASHINLVQPTTRFAAIRVNHQTKHEKRRVAAASSVNDPVDCEQRITPQCLKQLYEINYTPDPKSGSKAAFTSYLEQYARYSDLELFTKNIFPEAIGQNFTVVEFNGGLNDQSPTDDNSESDLDLQYMLALALPLPITMYSTGGRGPLVADLDQPEESDNGNEPYLEFLQGVLKLPQKDLPQVISTSYGENEQSVPKSYALTVCNLFAQLGSRGVSVIFISGDLGPGTACLSNDGKNTTKYQPQYPATCPFVTSVGSTVSLNETAAYFSGGGFSDYWKRPSYQDDAVEAYFKQLGDKNKPYFNRDGRGFPDVATQGLNFAAYSSGQLRYNYGTSCSGPTFGAIVALLNDARLRAKKPVLGFLNPLLYSKPDALNDIIFGGSTGCDGRARFKGPPNGSPVIPYAGWNATAGWDPVTGLGTPNFPKLLKAAMPAM